MKDWPQENAKNTKSSDSLRSLRSFAAKNPSEAGDLFDNRLIFGDNLLALKALEQEFTGKIKCNQEAKKEIIALFGADKTFDTPKPERLIERVIRLATNPGELVLDSFGGSGTTGAVAHKMGRRWIMVELGEHCHTHIIPRLKKVVDGADPGGITEAVG